MKTGTPANVATHNEYAYSDGRIAAEAGYRREAPIGISDDDAVEWMAGYDLFFGVE